jgi:hypothetical protein
MPYITPRQIATESSTIPKSVMNTMLGGYFWADSVAARDGAGAAAAASITNTKAKTIEPLPLRHHAVIDCFLSLKLREHSKQRHGKRKGTEHALTRPRSMASFYNSDV